MPIILVLSHQTSSRASKSCMIYAMVSFPVTLRDP